MFERGEEERNVAFQKGERGEVYRYNRNFAVYISCLGGAVTFFPLSENRQARPAMVGLSIRRARAMNPPQHGCLL